MKAVRFTRHGKPDVLSIEDLPDLSPGAGEALIRIEAASINPSDVKNVQGLMEQTTLPRTPGRDFAGIVEAGPSEWIGAEVWGTGGDPASLAMDRMPNGSSSRSPVCDANHRR